MGQVGGPALGLAGTLVGSFFGGPIGGAIGGMAGGLIGGLIFGRSKKPLITDTQLGNSSYGNIIPILYGTARLSGTMIWQSSVATKSSSGSFKGLGGSQQPFQYHQSAAWAFCYGPAQLVQVYLDGRLFWDATATIPVELTKHQFTARIYNGTETQLPDFLIAGWVFDNVAIPAELACPAYRGTAYLVFQDVSLGNYGNRMPQVTCVWSSNAAQTTVFQQLNRFNPDVSSDASVNADGAGMGTAVDWSRNLVYQLSNDGTIRVYDLVSENCTLAKTAVELAPTWANVAAAAESPFPFQGIACGLGTDLYLWTKKVPDAPGCWLWTIDPNTLNVINEVSIPSSVWDDLVTSMVCFALSDSTGGTIDMLAGVDFYTGGFVINPLSGEVGSVPVPGGTNNVTNVVLGHQDATTGLTDIWFVYGNRSDATDAITIGRAQPGGDPSTVSTTFVVEATLFPADFGLLPAGGIAGAPGVVATYDFSDDSLVLTNLLYGDYAPAGGYPAAAFSAKWKLGTGVVWVNLHWAGPQWPMTNSVLDGGTVAGDTVFPGSGISVVQTATGIVTPSPIATADSGRTPAAGTGNIHFNSATNSLVYTDNNGSLYVAYLQRVVGSEIAVAAIIEDLCGRVGLTPDMINTAAVTATTVGYVVHDNKAAVDALRDVCNVYQIDMVESDYTLKFIPRGQPAVASITQADLGSINTSDSGQYWQAKSAQEQEMPLQVTVKYADPQLDYQPGSAYAKRTTLPVPTQWAKRKIVVDLPVVATNTEARQIAENWLYTLWASRETYETTLSAKYLHLDPTDNITVTLDNGDVYTARIESIDTGADFSLKLSLASEDMTTYAETTSLGASFLVAQQLTVGGFAELLQFNLPLLQDADSPGAALTRVYYAAGGAAGFVGGVLYRSTDSVNWPQYGALPSGSNWGHALTALPYTVSMFALDTVNSVTVSLRGGSTLPSSCAYVDLANGANAALLGQEIIQFQTVVDNADGTLTLSQLVRAQRGTDWATSSHVAGEIFVLLQPGLIGAGTLTLGEIGTSEQWKLVQSGATLGQTSASGFAYLGYDLKPYAPVNFSRAPSGSDLAVSWIRRTRIGGDLIDGTDTVPLSEDSEAYSAYVIASAGALSTFDPTNPATYVRAFTGLTSPTLTYTAAEMTADSFVPATQTLFIVVYQISGQVGRGFAGYQALPAF